MTDYEYIEKSTLLQELRQLCKFYIKNDLKKQKIDSVKNQIWKLDRELNVVCD